MADGLQGIRSELKNLPTIAANWGDVGNASTELLAATRKLKDTRQRVLATAKNIGNNVGDFRAEIEKLRQQYLELEASARSQIDGSDGTSPLVGEILETVKVTEATLTYVATDETRRPRPVPAE